MKSNLDLATEYGADLMPNPDAKRTLAVFDAVELDAFAERIRADERERCALLADAAATYYTEHTYPDDIRAEAMATLAASIRKGAP